MTTAAAKKAKIQYGEGKKKIACFVWLAVSGSNQIEFADGTTATPSPLNSYAHTHGGAAYQAANEAWHEHFAR
jgi:hypothetical protein